MRGRFFGPGLMVPLCLGLGSLVLLKAGGCALDQAGFLWRPWMAMALVLMVFGSAVLALLSGLTALIRWKGPLLLRWAGGLALAGAVLFTGWLGLFFWAFQPTEHVVERDGRRLVAEVHSFLSTSVSYHVYINWFVMGREVVFYEFYDTGTDPLA